MTLVYLVIAWLSGIAFANWTQSRNQPVDVWWALGLVVIGIIATIVARRDPNWRRAAVCIAFAGLGMWRFSAAQPAAPTPSDLAWYNDKGFAVMTGVVIDAPDVRDNKVNLRVDVQSIRQGDSKKPVPVRGLALVSADRFGDYAYGDSLQIEGLPLTPPVFDTFSYKDYLARGDLTHGAIYTIVQFGTVTPQTDADGHPIREQGSPILTALFKIREQTHSLILKLLPSPQSALLSGILVGNDNDMPADVADAFRATSTSHIIAISGSNISIIAGFLLALLSFLNVKNKVWMTVAMGLWLGAYTIFVGAAGSEVRAAIMAFLAMSAQIFGRRSDGLTALFASIGIMTAINPEILFDVGLNLSFFATLGLILYSGPLMKLAERGLARLFSAETARRLVTAGLETVLITIAVQITTLPIMLYLGFGRPSLIALITNILVVPVQSPIMSLGILAVIVGTLWFPAGQIVAWLVNLPLAYSLAVIRAMAQLPDLSVPLTVDVAGIAIYYGILFAMTALLSQPKEDRQKTLNRLRSLATTSVVSVLGLAVAVYLWALVISRPDGKLHVWFLEVGAGNAILVQTPNGAHILVDGGENATRLRTALGDRLPFYKNNIDLLIVTQPKSTEIMGLPPLFDRYRMQNVITNGQTQDSNEVYRALQNTLSQNNANVQMVTAGYKVQTDDGVLIEVLNPATTPNNKAKPGDAPLILRLTYGSASFLITSDLTQNGMQSLLDSNVYLGARVVELPSNGDDSINTPDWLAAVNPQIMVIEAEQGNPSAQPKPSFISTLSKEFGNYSCGHRLCLYRTDLQGTIEFASDGKQLWISTAR